MKKLYKKDFTDKKTLEQFSSAFTLSDMEVFIFPELFYPLVLANIMSPIIWEWRNDPWFKDIKKKSFTYKVNRIKQFIMQNFVFNLDLSTWGLTTKTKELERFKDFFDMELLKQSNALFGYEGDKYYFDIDIRKHFGLDKFDSDIIPYWKTETVEAMSAFKYKENFSTGAGECVSLSALYAATMFVIGQIPLEKIFLIATPLHSQDFIIEKDGIITNNRRIVTHNMWFNGTSLSTKARRAMENEKVTIVSHISGYIHTLYNEATIHKDAYNFFSRKLREFLTTELTNTIFINFLRFKSRFKTLFQYRFEDSGTQRFILLEKMFEYEHTSKFNVSSESRELLLKEIEGDDFHLSPIQGKIMLNDIEDMLNELKRKSLKEIEREFTRRVGFELVDIIHEMFREIKDFISTDPKLPDPDKNYISTTVPDICTEESQEEIMKKIYSLADNSDIALLTMYVFRQMDIIDWLPFIKTVFERNPVSVEYLKGKTLHEVFNILNKIPDESIYDGKRLALPDEVWNFKRGDGIEKGLLLANFIIQGDIAASIEIEIDHKKVLVKCGKAQYAFRSDKDFRKSIRVIPNNYEII